MVFPFEVFVVLLSCFHSVFQRELELFNSVDIPLFLRCFWNSSSPF